MDFPVAVWLPADAGVAADRRASYLSLMLRVASRFLGIWFLAAALAVAVIDGAKSLAASEVVVTDLGGAIRMVDQALWKPGSPEQAAQPVPDNASGGDGALGPAEIALRAPAAPLLALGGVLFLIFGRRQRRHALGREHLA